MTIFILSPDALLWSTLWLSVASLLALLALRGVRSPVVHRVTCVVILLQGWIWWRCDCPVLPATVSASTVAISNEGRAVNIDFGGSLSRHEVVQAVDESHTGGSPLSTDDNHAVATPSPPSANVDLEMMEAAILAVDNLAPVTATPPAPVDIVSATPAAAAIDWSRWLFAVWIGGMLATVALWTARYVVFQRHLPDIDELPTEYQAQWREVCQRTGLSSSIPLWGLANLGPACGLMKGRFVVFVPTERWQTFSAEQRWAILLHEAAHLKRGDLWRSLCVRLLALPQWFNPLAWRMVRRFDEAAEWACDEFVLNDQQASAPEFAEALLSLSVGPSGHPQFSAAANGHPLSERVRRLLSPQPMERTMMKRTALVAALAVCTVANFVRLSAQEAVYPNLATATDPVENEPEPQGYAEFGQAPLPDDASFIPVPDGGNVLFGGEDVEVAESPATLDDGFTFERIDPGNIPPDSATFHFDFGFGDSSSTTSGDYDQAPSEFQDDPSIRSYDAGDADDFNRGSTDDADDVAESFPYPQTDPYRPLMPGDAYGGGNPYASSGHDAVIDMSEVFNRSIYFQERKARLQQRVEQLDREIQDMVDEMRQRQEELQNSEGDPTVETQRELDRMQAEFDALTVQARTEMRQVEVEIYYDTYRRIRAMIAAYARENQIYTVRRVRNPVSDGEVSTEQILELLNRDIVYSADEPRDITEDIVERLNAIDAQATAPVPINPYYSGSNIPTVWTTDTFRSRSSAARRCSNSAAVDSGCRCRDTSTVCRSQLDSSRRSTAFHEPQPGLSGTDKVGS